MFSERDYNVIWHPFTQHYTATPPKGIVKGEGAYLIDSDNQRVLDLISSWWVNLHGHSHPAIAKAIYEQALKLEHVIFSHFSHEPAVNLAEKLLTLLPKDMSKIFYSDNGSTAVEIAIKMAYQFWRNQGERRHRFISFQNSYHGDTFGSMAVGKKSGFFSAYEELFFSVDFFSYPPHWLERQETEADETAVLQAIEKYLVQHSHETAALIIEPLIQGAGGMRMCRPDFLKKLLSLLKQYNVLVIFDEVMTGFGRTTELFACVTADVSPDIICLAKGLTGGFLPLAVTACQEHIYQAFLAPEFDKSLVHGHSFTANPLGCAAALASLELLLDPATVRQRQMIERVHEEMLSLMAIETDILYPRYCGTVSAFDLPIKPLYGSQHSIQLRDTFYKRGLLLRPLGNVLYLMPPYCVTENELRHAYKILIEELQGVNND